MIKIRKFKPDDTLAIAKLIKETFKRFNGRDYFDKKAVAKYLKHYDTKGENLLKLTKFFQKSRICYVALNNKRIVGVVRGRADKIFHLFVLAKYHHGGIGGKLMKKFEAEAKQLGVDKIKLNASLYAVPFYQKIGYKKSTGIRNLFGLKVWPMGRVLK